MTDTVTTTLRGVRHRWKVLSIGVAANACFSMVVGGLPATAVFMRADYHITNAELGFVLGMLGLGIAISELPWGLMTDRWGDRPVLITGLLSTGAMLLLMAAFAAPHNGFVPAYWLLIAGVLGIGLLGSSVNGSSGRAIMAWFQEGERGLAMSIRQTAVPMGYGLGALLLPWLAARYGFVVLFIVSALLCVVAGYYAWLWLHEPDLAREKRHVTAVAAPITGKGPLQDPAIWKIVLAIGILCGPQFALLTFGSVFLHDFAHIDVVVVSVCLAVIQIGAMVLRIWSGRWTDKKKNRKGYLRGCTLLSILSFVLLSVLVWLWPTLSHTREIVLLLVGLFILSGMVVSAWHGVAYTELASMAGAKRAGTALAMGNTSVFVVMFITPIAIPWLQTSMSWSSVWLASALCAVIALIFFPKVEVTTSRETA
ncbi:MFS transporter [Prodigiosinella confusarubida]|uniref:MFS transporter n=1 Tax=Serratia sp. (strain ATCC 39006) TaxID=104623 RepID=A0A2I5T8W6_SERS3|nr:MFS transporter [Serratia sp. ATCC 39006]AUH01011.1 MFS transporter [Serratia sp. ATCC 39006]AUH05332.1 MFS transporter [Serratia sp. ATCC 39006]